MLKISVEEKQKDTIVDMEDMEPLQIGEVVFSNFYTATGSVVMRTAKTEKTEIVNISNFTKELGCPIITQGMRRCKVRLFPPGTKLTFEVL